MKIYRLATGGGWLTLDYERKAEIMDSFFENLARLALERLFTLYLDRVQVPSSMYETAS